MKSFFTRIQNKFSAEYSGRYVATIMEEVAQSNPAVVKALDVKGARLVTEWSFQIGGKTRIADLAVLDKEDNITMLIEVKFEDHKNPSNHAQIKDYLKYIGKNNSILFLCMSAFRLLPEDQELLDSEEQFLLFSNYVEKLNQQNQKKHDPAVKMLIDFFKERGMMMQDIDEKLMKKMMIRFFKPHKGEGKQQGNRDMIEGIPSTLSALMQNIRIISYDLQNIIGSRTSARIDFTLLPEFKIHESYLESMKEDGKVHDEEDCYDGKNYIVTPAYWSRSGKKAYRNGGTLYVYARHSFQSKSNYPASIDYGMFCFVGGEQSAEIEIQLYSEIRGKKFDSYDETEGKGKVNILSNRKKYSKGLLSVIRNAISELLSEKKNGIYLKENKSHLTTMKEIMEKIDKNKER